MATSPDYSPVCSPDFLGPPATSLDSLGPIPIGLGAATDLFCAAKAAEGASPRTVEWYQMILVRAVRQFGEARPVDAIPAADLRAWLLELRSTLAPESVAGYIRGLKAFGNWCAGEELAAAGGFRGLVPAGPCRRRSTGWAGSVTRSRRFDDHSMTAHLGIDETRLLGAQGTAILVAARGIHHGAWMRTCVLD